MKYAIYPLPLLGPCPCRDCGEPLYWARRNTRVDGVTVGSLHWRNHTGHIHRCVGPSALSLAATRRNLRRSQIRHESIHHGWSR